MNLFDTIAAVSTALTESAISVIRISGPDAFGITGKIFRQKNKSRFNFAEVKSHTVHFGYIYGKSELIDEVLISVFKKPASYTGEDVIEISSHGGVFSTRKILDLIISQGARHAEPGEFTKRAFLNGRIDLSQAEAIADLIKSKTDDAHKYSIAQLGGSMSDFISAVRKDLINIISLVELELDFAEEDIEFVKKDELKEKILGLKKNFGEIISTYIAGKVIRDGINLVIAGRPNSGKSSLFNFFLSSDRAIVSDIPGTTRDYIQENIVINGLLFNLIDTAGLRFSQDEIETEGVKRSYEKIKEADLILFLIDSTGTRNEIKENLDYFKKEFSSSNNILCFSKTDLIKDLNALKKSNRSTDANPVFISIFNIETMEKLKKRMTEKFTYSVNLEKKDKLILTNIRHKNCLENVIVSLDKSLESLENGMSGEFISLDLRNAIHHLGEITGEFTNDEILNNIFSTFCIGK